MIFFSKRITNAAKAYMGVASLFMISAWVIYLGSKTQNKYIIGAGAVIVGFTDCSSMVVALTLAGNWR